VGSLLRLFLCSIWQRSDWRSVRYLRNPAGDGHYDFDRFAIYGDNLTPQISQISTAEVKPRLSSEMQNSNKKCHQAEVFRSSK
jgi:hypothetical protein